MVSWKIIASAVGGTVVAVAATPVILTAVGFGAAGIAGGSLASSAMSAAAIANGGGVAAGSLVAVLQSAGAGGAALLSVQGAAGAAGAAVGTVIGAVTAGKKDPEDSTDVTEAVIPGNEDDAVEDCGEDDMDSAKGVVCVVSRAEDYAERGRSEVTTEPLPVYSNGVTGVAQ